MKTLTAIFALAALMGAPVVRAEPEGAVVRVSLSVSEPSESLGEAGGLRFSVGYGRDGVSEEGTSFRGGVSLLGKFRINAILTEDGSRFEISPDLVAASGKTEDWLRVNLFRNMSSIDFDGDGKGREYGGAYISLQPLDSSAPQPFTFNHYKGVFRWYSYAIHGTQDPDRIGKRITGGCINVGDTDLEKLLKLVKLGDVVVITSG